MTESYSTTFRNLEEKEDHQRRLRIASQSGRNQGTYSIPEAKRR